MFSKRLLEIASLVPVHSTVVDVGCDHGLLDIYLTLHRNCKCTASDINENCLKSARENIKKYSLLLFFNNIGPYRNSNSLYFLFPLINSIIT